jgi:hypothetical protein
MADRRLPHPAIARCPGTHPQRLARDDCSCAHSECAQGDNGQGRADSSCPRPGIHDCYSRYHRGEWRRRNPSRAGRQTREPVRAPHSLPPVASSSRGRGSLQATVTAAPPDTGHLDPHARSDARSRGAGIRPAGDRRRGQWPGAVRQPVRDAQADRCGSGRCERAPRRRAPARVARARLSRPPNSGKSSSSR